MKLLSVNVGTPRPDGDRKAKTGIYKKPVEAAFVAEFGLEGDAVCNTKHHGGRDQAVYLYDADDYDWWSRELGHELAPGTFGENLTTQGVPVADLAAGDRLTIGEVVLEATAPRIPCATLERRMGIDGFVRAFLDARRSGAYFRVLHPGRIRARSAVSLTPYAGERVLLLQLFDEFHRPPADVDALRRILAAPVAERVRSQKEAQLATLLARKG